MKIQDHRIFRKVLSDCNHPIYNLLPEIKDTNYNLRRDTVVKPLVRTTRFMNVFSNRLVFRYYPYKNFSILFVFYTYFIAIIPILILF